MYELTFPVSPVAASRPRVSKWGSYYTGAYKQFRIDAADVVLEVLGEDFTPLSSKLPVLSTKLKMSRVGLLLVLMRLNERRKTF